MKNITETPNYDYLMEISRGDEKFVFEIIQLFISKMPINIEEIEHSVSEKKWEEVGFYLHKLKSPLKILAIDDIVDKVESLEKLELSEESLKAFLGAFDEIKKEIEVLLIAFKSLEFINAKTLG